MARNSEKAQSMLYRFREQQAAELGIIDTGRDRRPRLITQVDSIPTCEKWRGQVVKEISRKVTKIQDPSLTDYQIRDLNDEINKLMREKHMWEVQLRNLGGPNYMRFGAKVVDEEGREVPGNRGYRYFGRARELPGVKELFESAKPAPATKKPKSELQRNVDADYYGYRDEDDGKLLEYEGKQEEIAIGFTIQKKGEDGEPPKDWVPIGDVSGVPSQKEVEEWLVERRKKKLLEKYT